MVNEAEKMILITDGRSAKVIADMDDDDTCAYVINTLMSMPNLVFLDVSNCKITDLNVLNPLVSRLKALNISYNGLSVAKIIEWSDRFWLKGQLAVNDSKGSFESSIQGIPKKPSIHQERWLRQRYQN